MMMLRSLSVATVHVVTTGSHEFTLRILSASKIISSGKSMRMKPPKGTILFSLKMKV